LSIVDPFLESIKNVVRTPKMTKTETKFRISMVHFRYYSNYK